MNWRQWGSTLVGLRFILVYLPDGFLVRLLVKKICGIKVIKLDGSDLNLWEAFGRYGGYTAGFATGLMGFIQVYWDPNRQAIQDKISGTLVVVKDAPKVCIETKLP